MVKFTAPEDRIVHRPGKVIDGVTDAEKRVLEEINIDPGYSYNAIAVHLEISKKTVAGHIKALKQKGVIERVGNNKTGYWKKYEGLILFAKPFVYRLFFPKITKSHQIVHDETLLTF